VSTEQYIGAGLAIKRFRVSINFVSMKIKEINRSIKLHIMDAFPDYNLDGYLVYKTFDHNFFIKGYLFYSKGNYESGLKVTCFVMPLFIKDDSITFTHSLDILNITKVGFFIKIKDCWWDIRPTHQDETFLKLKDEMHKQGEPTLAKINSSKDLCRKIEKSKKYNIRAFEVITYSSILYGSIKEQNKLLKGLIHEANNERDLDWVHQIKAEAELMLSLNSQEERIALLKTWANHTITKLKLSGLKIFE